MASAVLLGEEGSGRTTFLALLYAALVRYGGEKGDAFRLHASPEALELLGPLYEDLRAGHPPSWPQGPSVPREVELTLAFPPATARGWLHHLHHPGDGAGFRTLQLALARYGPAELDHFVRTGGGLDAVGGALLRASTLLLTIDASRLRSTADHVPAPPSPWDPVLAGVLGTYRSSVQLRGTAEGRRPLDVAIVLTRSDVPLGQGSTRPSADPGVPPGDHLDLPARCALAGRVLTGWFPRSLQEIVRRDGPGGPVYAAPVAFRSWIVKRPGMDGQEERLEGAESAARGWEPSYPYLEYVALLDHLRDTAPG